MSRSKQGLLCKYKHKQCRAGMVCVFSARSAGDGACVRSYLKLLVFQFRNGHTSGRHLNSPALLVPRLPWGSFQDASVMASERKPGELYPAIEPYNSGWLRVSDVHEVYYEECGNKDGNPVIFL